MPIPIPMYPKLSMEEIQKRLTSTDGPPWPEETFEEVYQSIPGRSGQPSEITTQKARLKEQIEAIHTIINRHRFFMLGSHDLECIRAHLHNAQEAADVLDEIRQRIEK